jgi:hypothetical protein
MSVCRLAVNVNGSGFMLSLNCCTRTRQRSRRCCRNGAWSATNGRRYRTADSISCCHQGESQHLLLLDLWESSWRSCIGIFCWFAHRSPDEMPNRE